MFDWLFKRNKPETEDSITNEIVKLREKIAKVKPSCWDQDAKVIEPLQHHIEELKIIRKDLRGKREKHIIDALNVFPLHTPCTREHLQHVLHADYVELLHIMYSYDSNRFCRRSRYTLKLDNWREVEYHHATYLERVS
jgi:hypothetical protein